MAERKLTDAVMLDQDLFDTTTPVVNNKITRVLPLEEYVTYADGTVHPLYASFEITPLLHTEEHRKDNTTHTHVSVKIVTIDVSYYTISEIPGGGIASIDFGIMPKNVFILEFTNNGKFNSELNANSRLQTKGMGVRLLAMALSTMKDLKMITLVTKIDILVNPRRRQNTATPNASKEISIEKILKSDTDKEVARMSLQDKARIADYRKLILYLKKIGFSFISGQDEVDIHKEGGGVYMFSSTRQILQTYSEYY